MKKMINYNTVITPSGDKTGSVVPIVISRLSIFQAMPDTSLRFIVRIYMERVSPRPLENQLTENMKRASNTQSRILLLQKTLPSSTKITLEHLKLSWIPQR